MNIKEQQEIKKEFELERVIFFSDAVFAIIITIMVLDVKLPEISKITGEQDSKNAFVEILPKFSAYCFSFFAIGGFWMRHLNIFSFLKAYDKPLVALNLFFLFTISLFPFALSFGFSSSHIMHYTWGIITYMGIFFSAFFTQTLLIGYMINNKETLCTKTDTIEKVLKWKIRKINAFVVPAFLGLIVCTILFNWNFYIIAAAAAVHAVIIKKLKKKYYPDDKGFNIFTLISYFKSKKHQHKKITTG